MCYFLGDLSSLGVVFWRILGYWRKWSRSNLDWAARIGICGIYGYIIYINDICQTWLLVDDKNLSHTTVVERRALSITDDLPEMEHCVCRMISNLDRKKAWWTEFSERLRLRSTCGACCSLCWYVGFLSESNSLPRSNTTHTPQTCSEHFRLHTKQTYKSKRTQPTKSHLGMCQNLCIYILWYIYIYNIT